MSQNFIRQVGETARSSAGAIVSALLPQGHLEQNEWVALNPTRPDRTKGSFKICVAGARTGSWSDFATGDAGGDLVSLLAYIRGHGGSGRQFKAATELNSEFGLGVDVPVGRGRTKPRSGKADAVYAYRDPQGRLVAEVYRWEPLPEDGHYTKTFRQRQPGLAGTREEWTGPAGPPVWRADEIAEQKRKGGAFYFVVEGEKSALAMQEALGYDLQPTDRPALATCWMGGSSKRAIDKTEWSIFAGQVVMLIPDDDRKSRIAMIHVARKLDSIGVREVRIVDIMRTQRGETGRDADDLWNTLSAPHTWNARAAIRNWIAANRQTWKEYEAEIQAKSPKTGASRKKEPSETQTRTQIENYKAHPWRSLGISQGSNGQILYHIMSVRHSTPSGLVSGTGHVHSWTPREFIENNFYSIADRTYWMNTFTTPDAPNIPWKNLTNIMMQQCQQAGYIDLDAIQYGRGVWRGEDGKPPIAHFGDKVYDTASKEFHPSYMRTTAKRVWIQGPAKRIPFRPCDDEEAMYRDLGLAVDVCASLDWTQTLMGELALTWAMLAPFGGLLTFRPHLYLTGASGAGKSEFLKCVIQPMIGEWCTMIEGNSTEAGIRNAIGRDGFPVTYDEGDVKAGPSAAATAQNIMHLARVSSTESRGHITNAFFKYKPRSMFCFAAINPMLNEAADRNRFIRCHLDIRTGVDRLQRWHVALDALHRIGLTPTGDLHARSFWFWMGKIWQLARPDGLMDHLSSILVASGLTTRDAQRLSGPLAMLLVIRSKGRVIDHAEDLASMTQSRMAELRDMCLHVSDTDADTFLSSLMSMRVPMAYQADRSSASKPLSWVLQKYLHEGVYGEELDAVGIRVVVDREGNKGLFVANTHETLSRHFRNTRWEQGHSSALSNMGAVSKVISMHGRSVRGMWLPSERVKWVNDELRPAST